MPQSDRSWQPEPSTIYSRWQSQPWVSPVRESGWSVCGCLSVCLPVCPSVCGCDYVGGHLCLIACYQWGNQVGPSVAVCQSVCQSDILSVGVIMWVFIYSSLPVNLSMSSCVCLSVHPSSFCQWLTVRSFVPAGLSSSLSPGFTQSLNVMDSLDKLRCPFSRAGKFVTYPLCSILFCSHSSPIHPLIVFVTNMI